MDKKFSLQLLGLVIVIFGAFILGFNQDFVNSLGVQFRGQSVPQSQGEDETQAILRIIDGENEGNTKAVIGVDVADEDAERRLGLGGRESLNADAGMLFVYQDSSKYTYWMKGLKFPLDFLWIMDDSVVDVLVNVPPPLEGQPDETLERYSSKVAVNKVLEVNAGFIAANNVKVGDKIVIQTAEPSLDPVPSPEVVQEELIPSPASLPEEGFGNIN